MIHCPHNRPLVQEQLRCLLLSHRIHSLKSNASGADGLNARMMKALFWVLCSPSLLRFSTDPLLKAGFLLPGRGPSLSPSTKPHRHNQLVITGQSHYSLLWLKLLNGLYLTRSPVLSTSTPFSTRGNAISAKVIVQPLHSLSSSVTSDTGWIGVKLLSLCYLTFPRPLILSLTIYCYANLKSWGSVTMLLAGWSPTLLADSSLSKVMDLTFQTGPLRTRVCLRDQCWVHYYSPYLSTT